MPDTTRLLPTIDLRSLDAPARARREALARLRAVAREIGFFYVEGHGISANLLERVAELSRRFFDLPERDKLAIEMVNSPHFRGYTRVGAELTRGDPDRREQVDIASERPTIPALPGAPPWTRLQGPNQWPAALPELRPSMQRWQDALTIATVRLLRGFAAALGQSDDAFDDAFGGAPIQHVKLIRYPGHAPGSTRQGVGAHKDNGFLTFVLQDDQGGLQIESDGGAWLDVPPRQGTFVVNIGESLEMLTNGYLRATTHRVVSPPPGSERISVAFFLGPRLDSRLPQLSLPSELAREARGISADPRNPLLREVGWNMLKGRLRSHPDVARRFYPDVESVAAGAEAENK
jgi:isopenicillin N synthase-like dioxygenase